jgi:hypothetical protein
MDGEGESGMHEALLVISLHSQARSWTTTSTGTHGRKARDQGSMNSGSTSSTVSCEVPFKMCSGSRHSEDC